MKGEYRMLSDEAIEKFQRSFKTIERSTLTVEETRIYIGVSVDMIYKLVREKALPHFRIGRRILFKREAIDRYIESLIQGSVEDEY